MSSTVQTDHSEQAITSYCSRRGCAHIFNYGGPKPFDVLDTLVADHAPSCVAGRLSATRECAKEWEPSQAVLELFLNPPDDPAMYRNFGQCPPAPIVVNCRRCNQDHPESNACEAELRLLNKSLSKSESTTLKRNTTKRKAARKPKPKPSTELVFTVNTTSPPRKRKGARTEAQRRALLMADPWTVEVAPHHVVCRGCKHTIKLDGRSLYYPGLWEKHRKRCMREKGGSVDGDTESVPDKSPSFTPEPAIGYMFEAMPPMDLAPRASYYRDHTV